MIKDKKNILFGMFILFGVLFSLSFVSAADPTCAITTPAASATISGSTYVNVTVTNPSIDGFNCSIYASSTLTANTTESLLIFQMANNTVGGTAFVNGTANTLAVEDANNYILKAVCRNSSGFEFNDTNTGITVDNTVPQTPSSLSPADASTETDGDVTFSATVTGANTTSCILYFSTRNPGTPSYAMTHSGNTCTVDLTAIPEETYDYYITASDETNTSTSATARFEIDGGGGGGGGGALPPVCGDLLCEPGEYQGQDYECLSDCPVDGIPEEPVNTVYWILIVIAGLLIVGILIWWGIK